MYNMTRHPTVVNLQQHYGDYMNKLTLFSVSDMADQYTSAMYNAREMISTRLAGLNSPVIQHVSFLLLYEEA